MFFERNRPNFIGHTRRKLPVVHSNLPRHRISCSPVTAKNGKQTITGKIEAWGEIGLAVKAYDYMDNTTNIYGVREITLTADSQVIFHSNLD